MRAPGVADWKDQRPRRRDPGGWSGVGARTAAMPLELELCPGRWVGGQHPCFIIAEIGQNHQGDLDVAKRMIRVAKVRRAPQKRRVPEGASQRGRAGLGGAPGRRGRVAGSRDHLPLLALLWAWRPACQVHV